MLEFSLLLMCPVLQVWILALCFLLHDDRLHGRRLLVATPLIVQREDYNKGRFHKLSVSVHMDLSGLALFLVPLLV